MIKFIENWFTPKEPIQEYNADVDLQPKAAPVVESFDSKGFREGSWVMTPEGVGIVTAVGVAIAKEDGTQAMIVVGDKAVPHVVTQVIRQAYIQEIPASRIGTAYQLGYESK